MTQISSSLHRIAVFYDGQYFYNVSNYYAYAHDKRTRISVKGLHAFIKEKVSSLIGVDQNLCQIVDAHYFRGRLSAKDADNFGKLYHERVFDDILMSENVVTHYLPLQPKKDGGKQEKGIDVWLALEAYELAIYKRFDVLVLIACDGDYVPLVRKLNTLGTRVVLLGWDFEYTDENNKQKRTRTSQGLLEEATYYLPMHNLIDERTPNQTIINMFVQQTSKSTTFLKDVLPSPSDSNIKESTILNIKNGFGFISDPQVNNVFFYYSSLANADFNSLKVGMKVKYIPKVADDGKTQAEKVWLVQG